MRMIAKAGLTGALALALVSTTLVTDADARNRNRVIGGVVAGLVIGGLIAGAAHANSRPRVQHYYAPARNCGELRRRAEYNEHIGRYDRARHWWASYEDCRNGY